MPNSNVHRVGSLYFVPATIRRLGFDPAPVLRAAGLETNALANPDGTIPYAKVGPLLRIASQVTRCPHFGLEVGHGLGLSVLGPIGDWIRHAPTLGDALSDISRLYHRNSHGAFVYFLNADDHAYWGYAIYHPNVEGGKHIYDLALLTGINILAELLGRKNMSSIELLLAHSEPNDPSVYRRFMGLSPRFNSDQSAFILPRNLLWRALPNADPGKRKEWHLRVQALWTAGDDDVVTQVRRATRIGLLAGNASATEICTQLGVKQRTMQRRLDDEGVSFQIILDETRYELCKQLLTLTRLGIAEVSSIIGYSDASILTRRFTDWSGMTPRDWRLAQAG